MGRSVKCSTPAKKRSANRKRRLVPDLTVDQKISLAGLVNLHGHIWRLDHALHLNRDATNTSWATISVEIGASVDSCKKAWKSLYDGNRNRVKDPVPPKKEKSGDSPSDEESIDGDLVEKLDKSRLESWEYYECTRFLREDRPRRETLTAFENSSQTLEDCNRTGEESAGSISVDNSAKAEESAKEQLESEANKQITGVQVADPLPITAPAPKFDIKPQASRGGTKSKYRREPESSQLVNAMTELIDLRKKQAEAIGTGAAKLKYESIYLNLDRILTRLPEDVVEDLNMEFQQLAHNALKTHQAAAQSTIYVIESPQ